MSLQDVLDKAVELRKAGKEGEAEPWLKAAFAQFGEKAEGCYAHTLYVNKETDEAYRQTLRVIKRYGEQAKYYHLMGNILRNKGKLRESSEWLLRANQMEPTRIEPLAEAVYNETLYRPCDEWENIILSLLKEGMHISHYHGARIECLRAIACWITGQKNPELHLNNYIPLMQKARQVADAQQIKNLDNHDAYHQLISRLMRECPVERNQHSEAQEAYVIGDSHLLTMARLPMRLKGGAYQMAPRLVMGVKAWHLADPKPNMYKTATKAHLRNIPADAPLFFSCGEIDCRRDEGIWYTHKKKGVAVEKLIANTVEGYIRFIRIHCLKRTGPIILFGIPPLSEAHATLYGPDAEPIRTIIKTMNQSLASACMRDSFLFCDLFEVCGAIPEKAHIDNVHLVPEVYMRAFQKVLI